MTNPNDGTSSNSPDAHTNPGDGPKSDEPGAHTNAGDGTKSGDSDARINPGDGLRAFQRHIERLYFEKDSARGWEKTFVWFVEEVGELARALHRDDRENLEEEFGDVAAWLVSLASLRGIDMKKAVHPYTKKSPRRR